MGYDTRYNLTATYYKAAEPEAVIETFTETNEEASYCLSPDGTASQAGKWYEHEKDMLALSAEHPHLLFILEGEGDEQGDHWKKYFQGGKVQVEKAKITIEPFDPGKLRAAK